MRDFICGYRSIIECGFEVTLFGVIVLALALLALGSLYDCAKAGVKRAWVKLLSGSKE